MGFMDKAKKLAEQAQEKLDEAQKNFNKGDSQETQAGEGAVQYDEHGRPIEQAPPAGATAPPAAEPAAPPAADPAAPPAADPAAPPAADPAAPAPGEAPASESPAESPAADTPPSPPPSGGADETPDPFKPIQ
jgi:hypothetical protein